jgi:hypothetical protein
MQDPGSRSFPRYAGVSHDGTVSNFLLSCSATIFVSCSGKQARDRLLSRGSSMWNSDRKLALITSAAAVLLLGLTAGCKGFFVNQPTSVTITPASPPSLAPGDPQIYTSLASFSDSTSKDVTQSATWSSSNPCIVAIVASGSDAGHSTDIGTGGSVTITAIYNGVVGTVTQSTPTGLTIAPCTTTIVSHYPQVLYHVGDPAVQFSAGSGSSSATWTSDTPGVVNITSGGLATFVSAGSATITATTSTQTGSLYIVVQ